MLKTAPLMDEVRAETFQRNTREILETRFPEAVPTSVIDRIGRETDLAVLRR